ncbi:hypothetical protein [Aggregatibacter actinomycetemcomitans]|nr:hypothetical protein [Aggregatibacter actinomycetemcomitans]KND83362.1 hypothetical protein H5P1_0209085 [Aggregatibacter actinomycetemcomitans serotype a str. H5P1]KOE31951.1 hypothetical protein D17P3_0301540 [Aggregatibacter actinomycetemcomitans D17P-3]TYA20262.1 hypothetical protein FXE08_10865 [Aggregatibacter actinomycetemcomitans]TYA33916.1 hypothetical protein FXB68_11260 [Aggregatibacter actinomycetemcomitans]TYA39933.1 hypothetical protein FXB79_00010 [Aggregatibacter actinomycet
MRIINYFLLSVFYFIFSENVFANNLIEENDYCLFKDFFYGENYKINVLLKTNDCRNDNNSDSMLELLYKDKVIGQTRRAFPKIKLNQDYMFEGERDIRLNNEMLEIEIAQPNRVMAKAYSFIFLFNLHGNNIDFYDYKISDLCYIPQEEKCPRSNLVKEDKNIHKVAKEFFYNVSLFDFDSDEAYKKIYDMWQGVGNDSKIKSDKSYLYRTPNKVTNMYLVKGDNITILDEKKDSYGEKWYFINYKGKKEINMWIKADSVDLN